MINVVAAIIKNGEGKILITQRNFKKSQCQGYVFRRRGMGGKISRQRKGVLCLRARDRKSLCIAQYVFESYGERNHKRHNTL